MRPSGTIHLPSLARCTANRFRKRHLPQMYHGQVCVAVCMIHFVGLRPTLGLGQSKLRYHSLRARWGLGQYWEQPYKQSHHHHHHYISLNREGRWGNRWFHNQFAPFFPVLHCPLGLAKSRPVHSLMLSSHLFLCPLCLLLPFTVPCKMALARPDDRETWPYHCSLHLFTIIRRSSRDPVACWILARTSSLVTWPLYEMCSILR